MHVIGYSDGLLGQAARVEFLHVHMVIGLLKKAGAGRMGGGVCKPKADLERSSAILDRSPANTNEISGPVRLSVSKRF